MKFKTVSKEELETMPFKIICDELNLGEDAFENQIADFFALLATEKRFIQLEKGYWDLRENHTAEINIKELEEELEDDEDTLEEKDEDMEEQESDFYDDIDETEDDDTDDDLRDLVIVDEGYEDESDL